MKYAVIASITVLIILFSIWLIGVAGEKITRGALATLMVLAATLIASALGWLVVWAWHIWQSIQRDTATTRQIQAEADRKERDAQYSVITAAAGEQVFVNDANHDTPWRAAHIDPRVYANGQWTEPLPVELASYAAYLASIHPRAITRAADAPQLAAPDTLPDILVATAEIERLLVVGGSGSGKTTLLQWFIEARRGHRVIVLDPHDNTRTWGDAQVVGAGQDYESILLALTGLAQEIKARYQLRATGIELTRDNCHPLVLVIDEWREVVHAIKEVAPLVMTCLTGGRKVEVATILGSHSDRAKPLGIDGEADLKDGFGLVRLKGGKGKPYSATLDIGDGPQPIALPGPFVPGAALGPREPVIELGAVELPMMPEEQQIIELYDAGDRAVTRISLQVFGHKGGVQSETVRDCLKRHGRIL